MVAQLDRQLEAGQGHGRGTVDGDNSISSLQLLTIVTALTLQDPAFIDYSKINKVSFFSN